MLAVVADRPKPAHAWVLVDVEHKLPRLGRDGRLEPVREARFLERDERVEEVVEDVVAVVARECARRVKHRLVVPHRLHRVAGGGRRRAAAPHAHPVAVAVPVVAGEHAKVGREAERARLGAARVEREHVVVQAHVGREAVAVIAPPVPEGRLAVAVGA
eukprot:1079822-Prymnesium_polylepis.1